MRNGCIEEIDKYGRYRAKKAVVKQLKLAKIMESNWGMISREITRFSKEVKRVKKGDQARDEIMKDMNGQILQEVGKVFCAGTECCRCQGREYKCSCQ